MGIKIHQKLQKHQNFQWHSSRRNSGVKEIVDHVSTIRDEEKHQIQ